MIDQALAEIPESLVAQSPGEPDQGGVRNPDLGGDLEQRGIGGFFQVQEREVGDVAKRGIQVGIMVLDDLDHVAAGGRGGRGPAFSGFGSDFGF